MASGERRGPLKAATAKQCSVSGVRPAKSCCVALAETSTIFMLGHERTLNFVSLWELSAHRTRTVVPLSASTLNRVGAAGGGNSATYSPPGAGGVHAPVAAPVAPPVETFPDADSDAEAEGLADADGVRDGSVLAVVRPGPGLASVSAGEGHSANPAPAMAATATTTVATSANRRCRSHAPTLPSGTVGDASDDSLDSDIFVSDRLGWSERRPTPGQPRS
jgi:hypothetical protein